MNRALAKPLLSLVVLLLATHAYAQSAAPTFPNPGKASMSRENQQALGMEAAAQVYQQMPVLPDNSPESQYIRQLGQKLVATIPQQYSWSLAAAVMVPMFTNMGPPGSAKALISFCATISMDDITSELVQQLQRTHGVKPVSDAETISVNGVQGRSVMMQSASPFPSASGQQQLERDWLVAVPQSTDVVIFFIFVAPQPEFARFQPTYEAMLRSVRF